MNQPSRLDTLAVETREAQVGVGYSWFVKCLRFGLPLAALGLIFIIIAWPKMEEDLVILPKEDIIQEPDNEIGENELLNPQFETVDSNNQPVNVTANRAIYSREYPDLVTLEQPNANIQTNKGEQVLIDASKGTYDQKSKKLFLENAVNVKHESGYVLNAEELRIDMNKKEAFSDKAVEIDGPNAKVKAIGLDARMQEGILVFKGPAKLTIKANSPNAQNSEPSAIQEQMETLEKE